MKERKAELWALRGGIYVCEAVVVVLMILTPYLLDRLGLQQDYRYSLWAIAVAFLFAVGQLRRIVRSVAHGEPFIQANVKRLKIIALCCLAVCVAALGMLLVYFTWSTVLLALFALLAMLVMRALAWVFQVAVRQKDELDTVI